MKDQRLRGIRQQFKDTYNAVMWLRDNQDKFSQTIHEPVILTVSLTAASCMLLIDKFEQQETNPLKMNAKYNNAIDQIKAPV